MRVVVILALLAAVAYAQPASTAERLYEDGQTAYDAKRYDDALVAWRKSYELSRLPALLFNIAQAYRLRAQPGDCELAVTHYKQFIALDPKSQQRATADGFLVELAACEPRPAPQPARPQPVRSVRSSAPQDPGATKRLAGTIVAASSVLLVAAGAYYGAKASALGDELTKECADGCDFVDIAARDADGRSAVTKQYVFYGLGAAGLVTGGVLYYLGRRERASAVAVVPRGDGGVVTWSGTW